MKRSRVVTLIVVMVLSVLLVCSGCKLEPRPEPIPGIYTIWLGDSMVACGYDTDSYMEEDGKIIFTNKRSGKQITAYTTSVYKIVEN